MKIAIMQPYFLPYIGYFQLIKAVDKFIFYDDVNYINRGWINRNRILMNGDAHYITVHQRQASQNKLINQIEILDNRNKIKKTFLNAYGKAPYFKDVWVILEMILEFETTKISALAEFSVMQVCKYLGMDTSFEKSSEKYAETAGLKKENRLIAICNANRASDYINPIGGMELYDKKTFRDDGINLSFLKTKKITYRQFGGDFVENLSIVDVMMFNAREEIIKMLDLYSLE